MNYRSYFFIVVLVFIATSLKMYGQNQPQFKVGDEVEIQNLSAVWMPGHVIGILNEDRLYYRVKLDDENAPNVYFNHVLPEGVRGRGLPKQAPLPPAKAVAVAAPREHDPLQFKVGDEVEVPDTSGFWVEGHVIGILNEDRVYYRVKLDDDKAPTTLFNHIVPPNIRAKGSAQLSNPLAAVGTMTDVYYDATRGRNRGIITALNGNIAKVRFFGCPKDETVDRSLLHDPATVTPDDPGIESLMGRWTLTKVGISSAAIAWGRNGGIEIGPTGTFTWNHGEGKPPVKGKWTTDAKVPGTDSGTQFHDGILISDADGTPWKVMMVKGSTDRIEVQRMCSGETIGGSRAR